MADVVAVRRMLYWPKPVQNSEWRERVGLAAVVDCDEMDSGVLYVPRLTWAKQCRCGSQIQAFWSKGRQAVGTRAIAYCCCCCCGCCHRFSQLAAHCWSLLVFVVLNLGLCVIAYLGVFHPLLTYCESSTFISNHPVPRVQHFCSVFLKFSIPFGIIPRALPQLGVFTVHINNNNNNNNLLSID